MFMTCICFGKLFQISENKNTEEMDSRKIALEENFPPALTLTLT